MVAVRGNVDGGAWARELPLERVESVAGRRIAMRHIAGTHRKPNAEARALIARERPDVYASRALGSDVAPTSDVSFQLLGADGPSRFASLQQLLIQQGKRCASVTKAVIVGGMDGTDEWRVDCSDKGRWQVWLSDETGASISKCTNPKCT